MAATVAHPTRNAEASGQWIAAEVDGFGSFKVIRSSSLWVGYLSGSSTRLGLSLTDLRLTVAPSKSSYCSCKEFDSLLAALTLIEMTN